ncbi:MAG TPA: tRNA preQ1(34) S-adenosylmethionine ribosyltransferase-isomerase QueA [Longimicrobiales bacterium]|nr:tRNA preQ1(34) S-adenosylmethionine ribosyltransferase-isomerase QueA [Longimicrobiales bacterium]
MNQGPLPTSAFDYELPPERIAQHPAERRDESRLLVLERATGATRHLRFSDLPSLIAPGDALVLNETRVFPARILGRKPTGAPAEVLLLRPVDDARRWLALVRPGGKLKPGRVIDVADGFRIRILDSTPDGERIVELEADDPAAAIERHGRMPLPPYIERDADATDAERYQTVYARAVGSVAAPTAGLHFTPSLLAGIEGRDVDVVRLVLHVGVGTFRPVEVEDPSSHRMHAEWYDVPAEAAARLSAVRERGGAIWAVGTTVARTLETVADDDGRICASSGWTDIFIRPPYRFRAVDRLITNFHLPRSTLLMLVSAFGGHEAVLAAYREAVAGDYRFYSYGDAMAII